MTYSPTFGAGAQTDEFARAEVHDLKVELIMDTHRVTGEFRYTGPVRRVVDILNSIDGGFILIYDGEVDSSTGSGERKRAFEVAQVRRDAIMLAIPRTDTVPPPSSFEAVKKVAVPTTLVVPGYEVSGKMHLVAEADPVTTPVLSTRHFTPITDAVITPADGRPSFKAQAVIVNLACTLFYAPRVGDA